MEYAEKFETIKKQSMFSTLKEQHQQQLQNLAFQNRFTLQEFKNLVEWQIDLSMWGESSVFEIWEKYLAETPGDWATQKQKVLKRLGEEYQRIKNTPRNYETFESKYVHKPRTIVKKSNPNSQVFGQCPVASEKTVCCNLYTIDAVKNCGFSCSYCSIQTMFKEPEVQFDEDFATKIDAIDLDKNKFHHIGTGQSSDALMWGNRFGILDSMISLAARHPQSLIEFKTKSKNISFFLEHPNLPKNIVCTWSLNPNTIIENEEHLAASLEERLDAAEKVAKKGILVGFHFHPMFWYEGWSEDYKHIFSEIKKRFKPEQITFISFGTLTFPKPILNKIRAYEYNTKILQMPLVPNPEGKWTYPSEIKNELFGFAYQSFKEWHSSVFFYLCMEEAQYWTQNFGYVYKTNKEFEKALGESSMVKVSRLS